MRIFVGSHPVIRRSGGRYEWLLLYHTLEDYIGLFILATSLAGDNQCPGSVSDGHLEPDPDPYWEYGYGSGPRFLKKIKFS